MGEISKWNQSSLQDQDKRVPFFTWVHLTLIFPREDTARALLECILSPLVVIGRNPQIVFSEGNYLFHEESFPVNYCGMPAVFEMVVGFIIFLFQGRIVFCSSLSTEAAKPTIKAEGVGMILCLKWHIFINFEWI